MKAPVLFIIFNRYEIVKKVFKQIQLAKPSKLYVFSDAPRNSGESEICLKARKFVEENINWNCEVKYKYEKVNLGAARGPQTAISWAFNFEDRLIIIEEDVLPSISFFTFCDELLERYKDDERIWAIGGLNHFEGSKNLVVADSYFYSKYTSIWGIATWKRCWQHYDFNMSNFDSFLTQGYKFDHVPRCDGNAALNAYKRFKITLDKNKEDTWDAQFGFAAWSNRGMGIVPSINLISNIGVVGVHSSGASKLHNLSFDDDFVIKKHPDFFQTNHIYDDEYFKLYRKRPNIIKRIKLIVRKIIMILLSILNIR